MSAVLDDIAISSATVTEGAEIEGRFTLEAMSDHAITVKGTITAPWTGSAAAACARSKARCRSTSRRSSRPARSRARPIPSTATDLNVEPLVRDAVLLSLPLAPLCEDACPGPEPESHPLGSEASEDIDPRWAGLGDLKFE